MSDGLVVHRPSDQPDFKAAMSNPPQHFSPDALVGATFGNVVMAWCWGVSR